MSALPTVPFTPPKPTAVTGPPAAGPSAPMRSFVDTLPPTVPGVASSVIVAVSGRAVGTSLTMRTVSVPPAVPVLGALAKSVTTKAMASTLSVAPAGCACVAFSV